jgi:hypothetical protein
MATTGKQSRVTQAACHITVRTKHIFRPTVLLFFFPYGSAAKEFVDRLDLCNANIRHVLNGTGTFMEMDKTAMQERGYFYTDWPRELPRDTSYPREKYVTLTYSGLLLTSSQ